MLLRAEVLTIAKTERGDVVLIKPIGLEKAVLIGIGSPEADSIILGIKQIQIPRPLTHDLLISILKKLDITICRIEITQLIGDTFYAQLILKRNGKEIIIDSRPSDCIALAVRVKCEMFIEEMIVDEVGRTIDQPEDIDEEFDMDELMEDDTLFAVRNTNTRRTKDSSQKTLVHTLQKKLEEAVNEENYEEAAVIRDRLKELE